MFLGPQIIADVHYVLLLITGWMSMVIMDDICGTISSRECNKTADASHYRYILHGICTVHCTVHTANQSFKSFIKNLLKQLE